MRAKLFRFDSESNEWKERGTGDVRLLKHKESGKVRLVMRRDKTLKVCANHYVLPSMKLQPNIASERSWVYNVSADVSDGEPTAETLAIRFANAESECAGAINTLYFAHNADYQALYHPPFASLPSQTQTSSRLHSRQLSKHRRVAVAPHRQQQRQRPRRTTTKQHRRRRQRQTQTQRPKTSLQRTAARLTTQRQRTRRTTSQRKTSKARWGPTLSLPIQCISRRTFHRVCVFA